MDGLSCSAIARSISSMSASSWSRVAAEVNRSVDNDDGEQCSCSAVRHELVHERPISAVTRQGDLADDNET
jgi:hypothetical protein